MLCSSWLIFLCFITVNWGSKNQKQAVECMEAAVRVFNNHPIPYLAYAQHMPLCITTVGYNNGQCPQNDYGEPLRPHWQRLNNFYSCINAFNQGQHIQQNGHTVVLWSGYMGKQRAQLDGIKSKALTKKGTSKKFITMPRQYADTQIPALQLAFQSRGATGNPDIKGMVGDLICVWLVMNSDITQEINMYAGIDFWRWDKKKWNQNEGTKEVLAAGFRMGLIVNAYFWRIEMLTIMRLGELKNVKPRVNIILKEYDQNGWPIGLPEFFDQSIFENKKGKTKKEKLQPLIDMVDNNQIHAALKTGWSKPRKIFGGETGYIPVVVRPIGSFKLYPIKDVKTILDLMTKYNNEVCNDQAPADGFKSSDDRLKIGWDETGLDKLATFVDWTKRRFAKDKQTMTVGPAANAKHTEYGDKLLLDDGKTSNAVSWYQGPGRERASNMHSASPRETISDTFYHEYGTYDYYHPEYALIIAIGSIMCIVICCLIIIISIIGGFVSGKFYEMRKNQRYKHDRSKYEIVNESEDQI